MAVTSEVRGSFGPNGVVDVALEEAGAVIAMIPCVMVYIALQRYYIRGLTAGVVKAEPHTMTGRQKHGLLYIDLDLLPM